MQLSWKTDNLSLVFMIFSYNTEQMLAETKKILSACNKLKKELYKIDYITKITPVVVYIPSRYVGHTKIDDYFGMCCQQTLSIRR